jgi:hypothetical protein
MYQCADLTHLTRIPSDIQRLLSTIVLNGEMLKTPACITLSAVHELECVLIYECKSTHGVTDEQIDSQHTTK